MHRPDTLKMCLVDMAERGETVKFLEGVEERPLRREVGRGVGREYIEIYDWRVLVSVGEEEKGRGKGDGFKKWFVGLV